MFDYNEESGTRGKVGPVSLTSPSKFSAHEGEQKQLAVPIFVRFWPRSFGNPEILVTDTAARFSLAAKGDYTPAGSLDGVVERTSPRITEVLSREFQLCQRLRWCTCFAEVFFKCLVNGSEAPPRQMVHI